MLDKTFALLSLTVKTYQEGALHWQEEDYAKPLQATYGLVIPPNY